MWRDSARLRTSSISWPGIGQKSPWSPGLLTWRLIGLSNRFTTGLRALLIVGLTQIRPIRETLSRVLSPAISDY